MTAVTTGGASRSAASAKLSKALNYSIIPSIFALLSQLNRSLDVSGALFGHQGGIF